MLRKYCVLKNVLLSRLLLIDQISIMRYVILCQFILWRISAESFSSVQSLSRVWLFATPCSMPGLPVHHQLLEPTQTHVHWVCDAIQPSHPLSSPSPPALNLSQHQSLFKVYFFIMSVYMSHAAAAAKSLQLCPTLCDPMDCSPPGPSIHGIFQARVLEWVAIAFSLHES